MKETILDVTGKFCPIPVLKARKKMAELDTGDVLVVMATDAGTKKDIPQFCDARHQLESVQELGSVCV